MRVKVYLTLDGEKETRIEGDARIFDNRLKPWLGDIGFWLDNWKSAGYGGPNNKGRVFIPWGSVLFIQELKDDD